MEHHSIPLVKAAFSKQFAEAMLKNGLSPKDYFEKVGLPTHDLSDPESLIPVKPFYLLANLIAVQEGIPDFGAQVAQIRPWHKVESLAPLISKCADLEDLLKTFCKVASSQRTHASFVVEEDEECLWFSSIGANIVNNDTQMELYRITSMIQLVHLATGSDWHPDQIQLLMPKTNIVKRCQWIRKSYITFSQEHSRISISSTLLKLPVNIEKQVINKKNKQHDVDADFIEAFRQIVSTYSTNRNLTLQEIAKGIGIPVRGLQRRLREHGLNYTDVLNESKFSIAKEKLKDFSLTIMEVGFHLGYSDPANFTHAFLRWSGMTPREFRKKYSKRQFFTKQ